MFTDPQQNHFEPRQLKRLGLKRVRLSLLTLVALVILLVIVFLAVQTGQGGVEVAQIPVIEIGVASSVSGTNPDGLDEITGASGDGEVPGFETSLPTESSESGSAAGPSALTSTTGAEEHSETTSSTVRETIRGKVRAGQMQDSATQSTGGGGRDNAHPHR